MPVSDLKYYLAGKQDYSEGVKLYLLYGSNETLKQLLKAGPESPFLRKKLNTELVAIAATLSEYSTPAEGYIHTLDRKHRIKFIDCPVEIQEDYAETGRLWRQLQQLQHSLPDLKEGKQLADASTEIVLLHAKRKALWQKIDHYIKYRKIIKVSIPARRRAKKKGFDIDTATVAQLITKRNSLRTAVSKYKKSGNPLLAEKQKLLDEVNLKLQEDAAV